jgi:hypothetical protein
MARGNPRPTAVLPMFAMPMPFATPTQQAQQRPILPFVPWGLQEARRARGKKKRKSKGQMEWVTPSQTPMGLIKLGNDETSYAYWNSEKGDKKKKKSQLGVGYFGY